MQVFLYARELSKREDAMLEGGSVGVCVIEKTLLLFLFFCK